MAGFKQVFGTSSPDNITTSGADNEIVFLLGGDDTINCDFQTLDYIIDTAGNDVLVTGGAFADFSIRPHAGIRDAYLVTSKVSGKVNLVKGIESFRFNEGDATLADFIAGNAPGGSQTFDKIITLDQFVNSQYHAQNGLSEQFQIELASWNKLLTIDGFNAAEDQVLIVSNIFSMAQEFVDANMLGPAGAWGWDPNGNVHIYNPDLYELNLNSIFGVSGNETIFAAEQSGWLKFGEGGQVNPEVVQINLSNFVNSEYTALDNVSEVITISFSQWNENLIINNFDADHDKLIINSNGQYNSAQSFINANVAGSAGTWAYDVTGGAHLFSPDFNEITLAGITNAENKPGLIQAETEGWIKFI